MSGPSQQQNSSQQSLQNTSQTGQVNPFGPSQPLLAGAANAGTGLLSSIQPTSAESGALTGLEGAGGYSSQFQPQVQGITNTLLSGGGPDRSGYATDALSGLQKNIGATASGAMLDPSTNPFFNDTVSTIGNDVTKRLKGLYGGAGRDPAGAGSTAYNLSRGIGEATAPVFAQQYQAERGNQLNAANSLFGAGGQTGQLLSGLDQTRLGNQQAGIGAIGQGQDIANSPFLATLAAEAQKRGIPLSALSALAGIGTNIGGAGKDFSTTGTAVGNTTGTATTQKNYGGLDYLSAIGGLFK